jgi:hypothetical protein
MGFAVQIRINSSADDAVVPATAQGKVCAGLAVHSGAWRVAAESGFATPMFAAASSASAARATTIRRRVVRFMSNSF